MNVVQEWVKISIFHCLSMDQKWVQSKFQGHSHKIDDDPETHFEPTIRTFLANDEKHNYLGPIVVPNSLFGDFGPKEPRVYYHANASLKSAIACP